MKNATTWWEEWETALIIIIYMPRVGYGVPCVGKGRVCDKVVVWARARVPNDLYIRVWRMRIVRKLTISLLPTINYIILVYIICFFFLAYMYIIIII